MTVYNVFAFAVGTAIPIIGHNLVQIMTKILSFHEALEEAGRLLNKKKTKKKHLLLGNGFSIACRSNIFSYTSLFDRADFSSLSNCAKESFKALDTNDFEMVMSGLKSASKLAQLYSENESELSELFDKDADGLKEVLVSSITENHPSQPAEILEDEYKRCQGFLSCFNNIYTLNYDLLLYWALMSLEPATKGALKCDDGFRKPEDCDADYVTWSPENSNSQNIFYLHGALHLFDAGSQLKKFTWVNTGVPLIDQIRQALTNELYPLIVAEGISSEKLNKILHSGYLTRCYRSFAGITGCLFIYGHSLAENDAHIIKLISAQSSKITHLYVSLYGNINSDANKLIIQRAGLIQQQRPSEKPLKVGFFDAETVGVWRNVQTIP